MFSSRSDDNVVVHTTVFSESPRKGFLFGSGSNDATSWMLLMAAVGMGYAMGTVSFVSLVVLRRAVWKGITALEAWVQEIILPVYTFAVVCYLAVRFYGGVRDKLSSTEKGTATKFPFISSFSLPSLRGLSTTTIPEEEEGVEEDEAKEEEEDASEKPIDMTGTYKVVENDNFDQFLQAQGLPWFLCKAAAKARPTHQFDHVSSKKLTIHIRGIIESETSYQIGGPHTETTIRGRVFEDSLSYLYCSDTNASEEEASCVGVRTTKVAIGQDYEVHVERRVVRAGATIGNWSNPDGHALYDLATPVAYDRLLMLNKVVYTGAKTGEASIVASQMFHRQD